MQQSDSSITPTEVPTREKSILIVEDESVLARAVQKRLTRSGFVSDIAGDLYNARNKFRQMSPDLILLDMRLPDGSGLDFLSDLRSKEQSSCSVLVMSAYGEIEDAVTAMKLGASDYLKKPVDLEELMLNIDKVFSNYERDQKLTYSAKREQHAVEGVQLLGDCKQLKEVRKQVNQISRLTQSANSVPPTVLILGETGTGKDVLARLLHEQSTRHEKPFVHVDCASLPKDLIEAELFGHEKGAFTNAHVARTGLIEAAEDGVLFLDEVGEIPLDLQSKLLAVLERRTLRRVGTTSERPVAAWFIAATNRNLETLSDKGEFRSDLYYRLNVLSVELPPLRQRGRDAILLANSFAEQTAHRYGIQASVLSTAAEEAVLDYAWPGNIRELKHMIERAVLLSGGGPIQPEQLALENRKADHDVSENESLAQKDDITLGEAELTLIKQALQRTNGNVSRAARELGITRMALRYRMKKYDLGNA